MKFAIIVAIGAIVLTGIGAIAGNSRDDRVASNDVSVTLSKPITKKVYGNSRTPY